MRWRDELPQYAVGVEAAGATFALYTALGLVRYNRGLSGNYDLGIFSQAAQNWANGNLPYSSIKGEKNLLGDHFSPVTIVFGIAWRIFPDPRSLIIMQALAIAVGVFIVWAAVRRWQSSSVALISAAAMCLNPGLLAAGRFEVHEVALGIPFMALLVIAVRENRFPLALVSSVLLVTVKEDLGLTIIVAGLLWEVLHSNRVRALILVGGGGAAFIVANFVVVYFNPGHRSPYLHFLVGGSASAIPDVGWPWWRFASLVLFAVGTGIVGLRSPLCLLAAPTLLWRIASGNANYWSTSFHYDSILVPIAVLAFAATYRSMGTWARAFAVAVLILAAARGTELIHSSHLFSDDAWQEADLSRRSLILTSVIPDSAPIAAEETLGPRLIARLDVHMLSSDHIMTAQYALLRADDPQGSALKRLKDAWLAKVSQEPGVAVASDGPLVLVSFPAPRGIIFEANPP